MKRLVLFLLLIMWVVGFSQSVKVMTYNIRLDLASDGDNRWDNRKKMLAGQVQFYEPDFMGVQEALPGQMRYLDSTLTAYTYIGEGRDGKGTGEYSAIFYNKEKFKMLEQSTFWLSETPEKVSMGWDAAYKRVCTYGLFQNKTTKQKVWIFNTHLDHVGNTARTNSTKLILRKITALNKNNYPVIFMGDFNLEETNESIHQISAQLNDSKKIARQVFGPEGTFNAFEFHKPVTKRIDFIFVSKNLSVKKYAVLSDSQNGRYPSDHLPVYVEIEINK